MLKAIDASRLPLVAAYPGLAAVARVSLGEWPTPVARAGRFGDRLGLPDFHVKREDRSHARCGGNKLRGLEFLLGEAVRRGARTIVTAGALGSHHVARTAWHARRLGIDTLALVVRQPMAEYARRNVRLALAAGARLFPAWSPASVARFVAAWKRGGMYISPGGTNPLACLGHVNAAMELAGQVRAGELPEPDYLYVPLGSLGTAAGLVLGCRLAGLRTHVVGAVVSYRWYATARRIARIARRANALMRRLDAGVPCVDIDAKALDVMPDALGTGYATITEESLAPARMLFDTEAIAVEGTYGAKAIAAAIGFIERRGLQRRVHLLWHTYQPLPDSAAPWRTEDSCPAWLSRWLAEQNQPLDARLQFSDSRVQSVPDGKQAKPDHPGS